MTVPSIRIYFAENDPLREAIRLARIERGCSVSWMMREALRSYLSVQGFRAEAKPDGRRLKKGAVENLGRNWGNMGKKIP